MAFASFDSRRGGAPMAEAKPAELLPLAADFSAGTLMGKRYVDADGAYELLCVKPGKGSLSVDGGPGAVFTVRLPLQAVPGRGSLQLPDGRNAHG